MDCTCNEITYTFVIPHYNIPTLLERCIKSIPERSDIQIVVVDDGSEQKPTINRSDVELVLLPKHTNAGNARNVGLSKAKGKWVLFPDADDFYNPGFLNELDKYVNSDNQVVFFSVNSVYSDTLKPANRGESIDKMIIGALNGDKKALEYILYRRCNVCNIMFSHTFIDKYDFRFESAAIYNDVLFHINCCYHLRIYTIIPEQLYCITLRTGSIQYSKKTLEIYFVRFCNLLKLHHFHKYIGLQEPKPLHRILFYGYNTKRYQNTKLQRHINRSIYLLKTLSVVMTRFIEIYNSRMFYVEEIKRSSAYAEQHC